MSAGSSSAAASSDRLTFGLFAALGIVLFLAAIIGAQTFYDHARPSVAVPPEAFSALAIRAGGLGLNSAIASFLWLQTISEIPGFPNGQALFFGNLKLINELDPKFSFPYAYTVIALPLARQYGARVDKAIEVGRIGTTQADPDWRIPFYTASLYQLDKGDFEQAVKFYDITGKTPGTPAGIQKFSANFGTSPLLRARTREVWSAIARAAGDDKTRARAKSYVERLDLFTVIEAAAAAYKAKVGSYPSALRQLVTA
ncbi:MAG: hypothetical protein RL681_808, partial [Candidatus Parcubacteria bacterium]